MKKPFLIDLQSFSNNDGSLAVLENDQLGFFPAKRIYFISEVKKESNRGFHGHKELEQIFIAPSGCYSITLENHLQKFCFNLNNPLEALYVPPGYWRELHNFSRDALCLVLASDWYKAEDYIHDKIEFLEWSRAKHTNSQRLL